MTTQKFVALGKVTATEKPPMRRQGGWMRRLQHQMLLALDERSFTLGKAAPKHED
jgi:hypothetical protein